MPDKAAPETEALEEIAGAIGKHGFRFIAAHYWPQVAIAVTGVAGAYLSWLAAKLGRDVLIAALVFFGSLLVGVWGLIRQRGSRTKRSEEMTELIDGLRKQIRGEGTSVAQRQLHGGIERIQAAMASQIASLRDRYPVLAQRGILDSNSALMVQLNRDQADLRAKEIADARKQLAELLAMEKSG